MANDSRSIGEKLRAMEERARQHMVETPDNQTGERDPAEGPREDRTPPNANPREKERGRAK